MKTYLILITLFICRLAGAQIENGMIAHFPFNNTVSDLSNNSIIATNNGGVFGLDRNSTANNAIEFDGVSTDVRFNDTDVKVALPITISAWVKLNSMTTSNMLFSSDNEYGNWWGYGMNIVGSGQVILSIHGGLGNQGAQNRRSFTADSVLQIGMWYHVLGIIRDYNDMSIYINCIDQPGTYSGSGATTMVYSSEESRIGSGIGGAASQEIFFDGSIDQLAIWNRELTPAEILFMCDIQNPLALNELDKSPKELIKVIDFMGRETRAVKNTPLIYIYSDGSTERVFEME